MPIYPNYTINYFFLLLLLDFPVVLFVADHRIQGAEELSCFDSETYYEQQYNMVYVCLTRAMEMLHIFTVPTSEFKPFKDLNLQ